MRPPCFARRARERRKRQGGSAHLAAFAAATRRNHAAVVMFVRDRVRPGNQTRDLQAQRIEERRRPPGFRPALVNQISVLGAGGVPDQEIVELDRKQPEQTKHRDQG